MRLNAFLARAGVASRRGADELIKAGRVEVNGHTGELNDDVSEKDEIKLDEKTIKLQKFRYILLNKPSSTVTTLKDPHGRKTVVKLVNIHERVVPVGRLDYDTTGVLLLTNDGELAHTLMHPSFEVEKVYEAEVQGGITQEISAHQNDSRLVRDSALRASLNKLETGIMLDGKMTAPAKVRKLTHNRIELTIHEGRTHQVKRMLAAVGLQVTKLHRSKYGSLELAGIEPGQWRELSGQELKSLGK